MLYHETNPSVSPLLVSLMIFLSISTIILPASTTLGQPTRFVIDPEQSNLEVAVTIQVSFIKTTDSASSPVSGWFDIELTPMSAPFSNIRILDMEGQLTQDVGLEFDFSILGTGSATGTALMVQLEQPGPETIVEGNGDFTQTGNQFTANGILNYDLPILGEDTLDLTEFGLVEADLFGTVVSTPEGVELQIELLIEYPITIEEIQVGTSIFTGTIIAKPETSDNPADFNGDKIVDLADLLSMVEIWLSNNPSEPENLNQDNIINLFDFRIFAQAWLNEG